MPPKKSTKKKAPKKRPQKPKTPKAETPEAPLESVGEKPIIDLAELNGSLDAKSRELVEIVELDGKGRGMVAKVDIERGTEIVRDSPLAASIYGIEVMPIQYGFKSTRLSLNFYPCSLCYKFHVQRTKQDLKFGSFCCQECKDIFQQYFGGNLHSIRSIRVQEAIWKLHEKIEDRTKLNKIIKTMKLLLRILIIKKHCPAQWAKIRQLDGECNNRSVRLDVKEWIDFAVKHFSHLYNDVTYSEIESIFLLAYINTWGFHVPGPDPESKGVITGTGLYYVGSMFNHSCNPNSAFLSTCLNNQKVLIAMKDIRQGEEVTCAYINCQQNRDARQNELKFGWNFDCTCQRCDEENDEDDEIDTTLICEQYTKEYEEQLELATTTENKIETKVRSRIGIHDYVSTI